MRKRFAVDEITGCWNWQGAKDSNGYGMVNFMGSCIRVHRMMAYLCFGLGIHAKKVVMHKCDNTSCANPDHLEVGTQKNNMIDCSDKMRIANSKKEICKRGHPLSGENLYICTNASGRPMRVCRACRKERGKLFMRARRHAISQQSSLM